MEPHLKVRFFEGKPLNNVSIRALRGTTGLYFIYLVDQYIEYPLRSSRLIYIGMSESKQNSIGNRLRDHASGQSGNPGLTKYIQVKGARFTHLSVELLSVLEIPTVAELEGAFLREFLSVYGCYPICNNQSGLGLRGEESPPPFQVEWVEFH